jgi:hypothetical protein
MKVSALSPRRGWTWGLALVLLGCASGANSSSSGAAGQTSPPTTSRAATTAPRHAATARSPRARPASTASSGLAHSTASNFVVQDQPPPGSCRAIGSGLYSRPDPRCTPGALNPHVTQATIGRTICRYGWTSTVRPPESVTEPEKFASMAAYGDYRSASHYEYDHFVPLELGGATNDRRNLWPEPGATPNPKDAVEDHLNAEVCNGKMTLAHAQHLIVSNWVTLARHSQAPPSSTPGASCMASAQWNGQYSDYDVYVHSNQPDQTVTVTAPDGKSASWHTDSSGYADVYFYDNRSAAGEQVTVRVGGATCHATL